MLLSKADVRRLLPDWSAERSALRRARTRQYDTSASNDLVVGLVRWFGLAVAAVFAVAVGAPAYSNWGAVPAGAAGLFALAAAAACAALAAVQTGKLLGRQDLARAASNARLTLAIHRLDDRISAARREHGLEYHPVARKF